MHCVGSLWHVLTCFRMVYYISLTLSGSVDDWHVGHKVRREPPPWWKMSVANQLRVRKVVSPAFPWRSPSHCHCLWMLIFSSFLFQMQTLQPSNTDSGFQTHTTDSATSILGLIFDCYWILQPSSSQPFWILLPLILKIVTGTLVLLTL